MENRREDLDFFYEILHDLEGMVGGKRILAGCNGRMNWPKRGVYFFFEGGELREDGSTDRVVRIGTHALKAGSRSTLWGRLRTHRGFVGGGRGGGGNHRISVFRFHVGNAILNKTCRTAQFDRWCERHNLPSNVRDHEHEIEVEVSKHIRQMPFLWLDVDDKPGSQSLRGYIEAKSIALLSNYNARDQVGIDLPSDGWLGNWSPNGFVKQSGLWNVNHVTENYEVGFLDELGRLVAKM